MRIFILFLIPWSVMATDFYIAQSNTGSGDGLSSGNAKASSSIGSLAVIAGDVIHTVGTIKLVTFPFSGTPASPVTLFGDSGSKLSATNGTVLSMNSISNLILANLLLENTATGSGLAWSNAARLVDATSAINCTVSNCVFQNEYVHTDPLDHNPDIANGGGFYSNGLMGTNYILSCSFSNVGWCISCLSPCAFLMVTNCSFINFDHGVVPHSSNWMVLNCKFGSTSNWDTTANSYHHDGIHYFDTGNSSIIGKIDGNIFSGDWGGHATAHIYLETSPSNVLANNNLFIVYSGNLLNNGCVVAKGNRGRWINNTFVGNGGGTAIFNGGTNCSVMNNIFNSFTTFIDQQNGTIGATVTYSNNIYANQSEGGNAPWICDPTSYNTFSDWTTASGDGNSVSTISLVINGSGIPSSAGVAINAGLNFSSLFSTDFAGSPRPSSGAWTDGAYQSTFFSPRFAAPFRP